MLKNRKNRSMLRKIGKNRNLTPCGMHSCYCPQMLFAKAMFLHMSVILSGGAFVWLLRGGATCMVALGGLWLLWGDMHGCSWGAFVAALGGHAWLLWGVCMVAPGGVCGSSEGACVVAPRGVRGCSGEVCMVALGGHAWLLQGGASVVAPRGVHGCSGEVCMVALGGHAWLFQGGACVVALGGMRGCSWGEGCAWLLWGVCVVAPGGVCVGYNEIRRYGQ